MTGAVRRPPRSSAGRGKRHVDHHEVGRARQVDHVVARGRLRRRPLALLLRTRDEQFRPSLAP